MKEDTQRVGVTEDPGDRVRWKQMICCCHDHKREKLMKEAEVSLFTSYFAVFVCITGSYWP